MKQKSLTPSTQTTTLILKRTNCAAAPSLLLSLRGIFTGLIRSRDGTRVMFADIYKLVH
jgi:hypothetical protein